MTRSIRRKGWFEDDDGVPAIYKDPDTNLFYTITINIKNSGTLTTAPTWASSGVGITNESDVLTGTSLALTLQVSNVGTATVSFTDSAGNEEKLTFRWKERDR